jgi:hypothetical protein
VQYCVRAGEGVVSSGNIDEALSHGIDLKIENESYKLNNLASKLHTDSNDRMTSILSASKTL